MSEAPATIKFIKYCKLIPSINIFFPLNMLTFLQVQTLIIEKGPLEPLCCHLQKGKQMDKKGLTKSCRKCFGRVDIWSIQLGTASQCNQGLYQISSWSHPHFHGPLRLFIFIDGRFLISGKNRNLTYKKDKIKCGNNVQICKSILPEPSNFDAHKMFQLCVVKEVEHHRTGKMNVTG